MHADVHERGSSEYPAAPLLTYLQARLQRAEMAYLRPPVPIAGGFDTRIYALQLVHVPQLLARARLYALYPLPILIHTAVSFASFFLTTPIERHLNTALPGAGPTEMMQDYPLHV